MLLVILAFISVFAVFEAVCGFLIRSPCIGNLSFYIKGFMGIVAQWLKEDCAAPVEQIIRICTQCILPCGLDAHLKPFGGGEAETV